MPSTAKPPTRVPPLLEPLHSKATKTFCAWPSLLLSVGKSLRKNQQRTSRLSRKTDAETLASQIQAVQNETNSEVSAYNQRIKNLDKFANNYQKRYQELQGKIQQIEQQGDDQVTRLKQQALQKQMQAVTQAENRMEEAIATDIARTIVMNQAARRRLPSDR